MASRWTEEEILLLKNNYLSMTNEQISLSIKRSPGTIGTKLSSLGLTRSKDLVSGMKVHRLTIIKKSLRVGKLNKQFYDCLCDCGKQVTVARDHLVTGHSGSCGCYQIEVCSIPEGEASYNTLFRHCKKNALTRNILFNLTKEEHKSIISQNCYYCDSIPILYNTYLTNSKKIRTKIKTQKSIDRAFIFINTVDRVNSDKGYTLDNCVAACWPCNEMKMDSYYQDFIDKIYKIVEFQEKKKKICSHTDCVWTDCPGYAFERYEK